MNGDPKLLFHIFKVIHLKIIHLEKNFFENIRQKVGFGGNYPLIFTLFDQNYDSKYYFLEFRLYMPQICGVAKKSKTF